MSRFADSRGRGRAIPRLWATVVVLIALAGCPRAAPAQDYCDDGSVTALVGCLRVLADYMSGTIQDGGGPDGEMKAAVDHAYENMVGEWTQAPLERPYLRGVYAAVPLLLLAYFVLVALATRFLSPRFSDDGPPRWAPERIVLVGLPVLLVAALAGERWQTYSKLDFRYNRLLPEATRPFVYLAGAESLSHQTTDSCALLWNATSPMLELCRRRWPGGDGPDGDLTAGFLHAKLREKVIDIGTRCRGIPLPAWIDTPDPDTVPELDCPVVTGLEGTLTIATFRAVLPDMRAWVSGNGGQSLRIDKVFQLRQDGALVYQARVKELIEERQRTRYTDAFWNESMRWMGVGISLLLASGFLLERLRKRELEGGSEAAGRWFRIAVRVGVGGSFLAVVMTFIWMWGALGVRPILS